MISIYSTITKIGIQGGKHSIKLSAIYTVINDTASIAAILPVMPTLDTIALLRHKSSYQSKDWSYRPGRVRAALSWLKSNNILYKDIVISFPEGFSDSMDEVMCTNFELEDDEIEALNDDEVGYVPSTNSGAPVVIDTLLTSADVPIVSNAEAVRIALTADGNPTPVMEREVSREFVNSYHNSIYFWEKCFPKIFPYGHGGPSDPIRTSVVTAMPQFHRYQLQQSSESDGRRCQQSATYIFSAYQSEMKRKIGSVSLAAANDDDCMAEPSSPIDNITNAQMQTLREYVNEPVEKTTDLNVSTMDEENIVHPVTQRRSLESMMTNKEVDISIKKILCRLVPYSKPLTSTALYRAGEKKSFFQCFRRRWFVPSVAGDIF